MPTGNEPDPRQELTTRQLTALTKLLQDCTTPLTYDERIAAEVANGYCANLDRNEQLAVEGFAKHYDETASKHAKCRAIVNYMLDLCEDDPAFKAAVDAELAKLKTTPQPPSTAYLQLSYIYFRNRNAARAFFRG